MSSFEPDGPLDAAERETRRLAVVMHLAHFAGWVVPVAGWLLPVVIWVMKKDELPAIDAHGKVVVNWLITQVLASALLGFLGIVFFFLIVTIPLLILVALASGALWIMGAVFAVVGAIKADQGEVWPYPASIRFLG